MSNQDTIFSGPEVIDLCESIMEDHRALKTIGLIFNKFNFQQDNGNAFQGKIQKKWFKSVIDEIILAQFEKLDQVVTIYTNEQKRLKEG